MTNYYAAAVYRTGLAVRSAKRPEVDRRRPGDCRRRKTAATRSSRGGHQQQHKQHTNLACASTASRLLMIHQIPQSGRRK
jgi:hypothetical protein